MEKIYNFLKSIQIKYRFRNINNCKTVNDLVLHSICKNNLKEFTFLEIGVFKGDNAIQIIDSIKNIYTIKIKYIGFDLFDDIDYLAKQYPEDYKQYNLKEYPYWEFESGGHTYATVTKKLASSIKQNVTLVKGDTTKTIETYFTENGLPHVDLVYIDGCHDYIVVKSDWNNCKKLFIKNPELIVAFDDYTYEGVITIYDEILKENFYTVIHINSNQFAVILKK